MQSRQLNLDGAGEIPPRSLLEEALRRRPLQIVVGEVRQEECLDLLIALNPGLPGMCTLHANSAREAVGEMCTLPLLAGENIGTVFVVRTRRGLGRMGAVAREGEAGAVRRVCVTLSPELRLGARPRARPSRSIGP